MMAAVQYCFENADILSKSNTCGNESRPFGL
jgi:hypothetical protein